LTIKKPGLYLALKGIRPGCSQPVIARCGEQRVNHWAHTRNRMCDSCGNQKQNGIAVGKIISHREKFYKNLIWVVDGARLKRDYPRFLKGKNAFRNVKKGIYRVDFPEEYFPSDWLESSVPVIFDLITEIPRKAFINTVISREWVVRIKYFLKNKIMQVI